MPFIQSPPALGNQYDDDPVLRAYLSRTLPPESLAALEPEWRDLGDLAGGELYALKLADRENEPRLTSWDAWGNRVDRIELSPLWKRVKRLAAERGLIGAAYERRLGALSRVHQMTLAYLLEPSSDVYACPLAMTDGAAKTLLVSGNGPLIERALPRLTSRDPEVAWTSGQWMTERTGGSDVGLSETVARRDGDGFRLFGTKWFTSATTAEMTLTLARPEGNPPGGSGLALFYLELRDADGRLNGLTLNRLKDKLGTRKVPTAEVSLDGTRAIPVVGLSDGVKQITPLLNVTRVWNSIGAIAGMRRALALARDYAKRRVAFGAPLAQKPLHVETLADLEAVFEGAFLLAFRVVELLGREENGALAGDDGWLLRVLTPIAKLTTGKQAVAVASEVLEAFGGAGYVEDTGLPCLLRDAQVLSIWEGTTNVLSLDLLRALGRGGDLAPLAADLARRTSMAPDATTARAARTALEAVAHADAWLTSARAEGPARLEAGARRLALTLGLAVETALLVEQAAWEHGRGGDRRFAFAAVRLARLGIDRIEDGFEPDEARALAAG